MRIWTHQVSRWLRLLQKHNIVVFTYFHAAMQLHKIIWNRSPTLLDDFKFTIDRLNASSEFEMVIRNQLLILTENLILTNEKLVRFKLTCHSLSLYERRNDFYIYVGVVLYCQLILFILSL